jgi:hypothetical protein
MKRLRFLLAMGVVLGLVTVAASIFANNQGAVAATFDQTIPPAPTPAPTATPGPPIGITPRPRLMLAQPLDTEEQVLTHALAIDSRTALWRSKPWSIDTPRLEPGRVTVKWYSGRSYDGTVYGPGAETGPVWVVTIAGDVRLILPGEGFDPRMVYDGVTYTIAQRTGDLLGVHTGIPSINQPFVPTPVTSTYQLPSAGTPAALTSSSCTQNPSGLSFRVTQQPGTISLPGASGPVHLFYVEGTGFVPGEKVTVVIKGRVTAPGTIGSTEEIVGQDSTFATSIGAAVLQANMPFDLFVIHRRGVACASLIAVQ